VTDAAAIAAIGVVPATVAAIVGIFNHGKLNKVAVDVNGNLKSLRDRNVELTKVVENLTKKLGYAEELNKEHDASK